MQASTPQLKSESFKALINAPRDNSRHEVRAIKDNYRVIYYFTILR